MRDLFVAACVFGSLPFILYRPYIGILMWAWLGYMNPHRLAYGFAVNFPWAYMVALVTLTSLLLSKEKKEIPWTRESVTLLIFALWMCVTTYFALEPVLAPFILTKILKILLMTYVTMMLINSKWRIELLVAVIVFSLGFYGVKGGIFTITTGGGNHVRGPNGTFIGGNNEIGLALIMTIPLMRYLHIQIKNKIGKIAMLTAMLLTVVAIFGTQSRGDLLGLGVMGLFLILKNPKKLGFLLVLVIAIPLALKFMPQEWYQRMDSISNYQQDASAQGRINAWHFAFNLANHRPVLGGGFEVFRQPWFRLYAPEPNNVHDAHSIYFEVLGEQGYVGLFIFLLLAWFTWNRASQIIKKTKKNAEWRWAADLAAMIQVSLIGYFSAGAFLGLANFDLYYGLIGLVVVTHVVVKKNMLVGEIASSPPDSDVESVIRRTETGVPIHRVGNRHT